VEKPESRCFVTSPKGLDPGPFGKPFETLRVPREIEGLRVPSLSRDFRRNDVHGFHITAKEPKLTALDPTPGPNSFFTSVDINIIKQ